MKKTLPFLILLLLVTAALVVFWPVAPKRVLDSPTPAPLAAVTPAAAPAAPQTVAGDRSLPDIVAWLREFQATPTPTPALLDEGRRLATNRQPAMLALMREHPLAALEQSLKWHEWAALPVDIQALVEQPFSGRADFSVRSDCRPPEARGDYLQTHYLALDGGHFDAFVYGRRARLATKLGTPLQGFTLAGQAALWENPAYRLEGVELATAQNLFPDGNARNQSWLTGEPINGAPLAALLGGQLYYFASGEEIATVATAIAEAEQVLSPHSVSSGYAAGFGGQNFDLAAFTKAAGDAFLEWTEQPKRVLGIRIAYTDVASPYTNVAQLADELLHTSNALRQISFQKTWLESTVTTVITLPNNQAYYEATNHATLMLHARNGAQAAGFNTNNFDIYMYCFPALARISPTPAFADINGPNNSVNGAQRPTVFVHELGHNYGLGHANSWRPYLGGFVEHKNPDGSSLEHQEYGDPFDLMAVDFGSVGTQAIYPIGHFSMRGKSLLNWIETNEFHNVITNGVYRVRRFDDVNARVLAGGKLGLKVRNRHGDEFWAGYRRNFTNTPAGAYLIWANEPDRHRFLDATPLSQGANYPLDKDDGILPPGQSYIDPSGSFRIKTLGQGGSAPNEYIDVEVAFLLPNPTPPFQLFTTASRATNGLVGSYVNSSLRARAAQEDWRSTPGVTISGTRVDASLDFPTSGWGVRASVGLTNGTDADWDGFSVQWDGYLEVNRVMQLATKSDDGSRMWIDVNTNGTFGTTFPELLNNGWGNGQGATVGQSSMDLFPGILYRIRIHYEEGNGGNSFALVEPTKAFEIFADAANATNGLTGSYVNSGLFAYAPQDDWRTSQTIAGTRMDQNINFLVNGWGTRPGLTGGANTNWENFSVQWDGWVRVFTPTRFATLSDESSRMWIDLDGNGSFGGSAPEFLNNNWGVFQFPTLGTVSALVPPGNYRLRIQYAENQLDNSFLLTGTPGELPGLAGHSLAFDGVNDFMVVSNAALALPTQEVTVEFWQRVYEQRNQFTFILNPDDPANRFSFTAPFGDGVTYWDCGDIFDTGRLNYTATTDVIGTWQHWAVVSSVAGDFQRIYRNGVLEANNLAAPFVQHAAHLVLGGRAGDVFKGELDEFRIWSVARSQEQIQATMHYRFPTGARAGLWAYWRFDDATGGTVTDLSGNGRHGTLVGGTNWVVSTIPALQSISTNVVTTLADSGPGSLREAVESANLLGQPSVITFAVTGTIHVTTGVRLPTFTTSISLLGPGTNLLTLSADNMRGIFRTAAGTTNLIRGLRLADAALGGSGAALANDGNTTLENCVVENCVASFGFGGAIQNTLAARLTATNCVFLNNRTFGGTGVTPGGGNNGGPGGGGAGLGGAIFSEGSLTLAGCAFTGNVAGGGNGGNGSNNGFNSDAGGNGGGPNSGIGAASQPGGAGGFGGGGAGGAGSFFSGSWAGGTGGFGGGGGASGAVGSGGNGDAPGAGGLYGGAAGGSFSSVSGGGGGGAGLGGAIFARIGAVTIVNCSFTGNIATNGVGGFGSFGGGNGANGQGAGGAVFNLDAQITALNVTYSDNVATSTDPNVGGASTVVTTLANSGPGSLRQAIANAAIRPGNDTVTFATNLSGGVVLLTSESLIITNHNGAVTVTATNLPLGLALDGQGARRVFTVAAGTTLTLDSLTITNGAALGSNGGGLRNEGTAIIRRCTFVRNSADFGGGIYSHNQSGLGGPAMLTLDHCTLANNQVGGNGGGLHNDGGATAIVLNCTIVSNTANLGGGVRAFSPLTTLRNCLVAGNSAGSGPDIAKSSTAPIAEFNLVGNGTDSGLTNGINGNLVGIGGAPINPRLGPLRNNGGLTPTHAPLGGSPAIDAGDPLFNGLGQTDQRGLARVTNARLDLGAVESGLRTYYSFDSITATDTGGASTVLYQGSGPNYWNNDHRGQSGSAIALNDPGFGTDNYYRLTTPHDPTNSNRGLGLQGDFTISVWIYPRVLGGWKMVLGSSTTPGAPGTPVLGLFDNRAIATFWNDDLVGDIAIPANQWTHLAWTYTSFGGQAALYVNGRLDNSAVGRINNTLNADALLGFSAAIPNSYFQGFMDEFAIFGEALSASQITALATPGGIFPTNVLPVPVLSPGLAAADCGWNVREIYAPAGNPRLMPFDQPSALHVANTPLSATVTNYTSTVINRYDSKYNPPDNGFLGGDTLFASDNLTPQGLINGDDDYFILVAQAVIQIGVEDDYTFGFSSDDGAQLRIKGSVFSSSTRLDTGNPANPAHRGDTLSHPGVTGNSQTLGVTHLTPGSYEVEFISWEVGSGAFTEVLAARGAKTSVDASFALLSPLLFTGTRPSLTIASVPPSPNVQLNWSGSSCYHLQSAASLSGPWTDLANGTNGVVLTPGGDAQFFRLAE